MHIIKAKRGQLVVCLVAVLFSIATAVASNNTSDSTTIANLNHSLNENENSSQSIVNNGSLTASVTVPLKWQKCLGGSSDDVANSINLTKDGGYIVAGYTESNDGNARGNHGLKDAWVVKLSSAGDLQWQKCLGGSNDDVANSINLTKDGGYIVAGYTESNDGNARGNHGLKDAWVVKLNSAGDLQWQKCLGGSSDDVANSINLTKDGGYIVAGYTESNNGDVSGNHGNYDFWVVKISSAGDLQWQKCLGGSGLDMAESVQQTKDEGYIVAGYTESNNGDVSGNHGGNTYDDFWVVKISSAGDLQWQKCLGGSKDDFANSIEQTADNGYIITGDTYSNDGNVSGNKGIYYDDFWIVKLNSSGVIQWQKCLGGSSYDRASSIQQTKDRGYIVAGETNSNNGDVSNWHVGYDSKGKPLSDLWIAKLDSSGVIQWQKCLGGSWIDSAKSIQQTTDGNYIVAGYTESNNGDVSGLHGMEDFWIVKLGLNNPPSTPSKPVGPATGTAGSSYSYSTKATDPDKDQVKYTFDWGDGTTNVTGLVSSGTSASLAHKWSKAGTYQVEAKATDSKGAESTSWSTLLSVKIT